MYMETEREGERERARGRERERETEKEKEIDREKKQKRERVREQMPGSAITCTHRHLSGQAGQQASEVNKLMRTHTQAYIQAHAHLQAYRLGYVRVQTWHK